MAGTQGKQRQQESLVGHTLHDGEYIVERVLGHGGMGNVYLAMHTSLNIPLALKQGRSDQPLPESVIAELDYILHGGESSKRSCGGRLPGTDFPSSGGIHTDRFLREALLLTRLQHVAIPTLYDYFFEDGYWYLVMDYIPGTNLSMYLRQRSPLPPLEALDYAMQLCDVLDYLHNQSPAIVFRDLKPSNIMLTPHGSLVLIDFGIARYFKEGQINDTTDFGSPGYASPEQYHGEGQTDGRSDLFSLGVILAEMLHGKRTGGLPGFIGSVEDMHNPTVSAVLSGLIKLATRTEPMYRFQSAHTFYLALERAYHIEEHKLYRQRAGEADKPSYALDSLEEADETIRLTPRSSRLLRARLTHPQEIPLLTSTPLPAAAIEPPVRNLEQRRQLREALHLARQDRLEQEHLDLVDESLKRRAITTSFSQVALPRVEAPKQSEILPAQPRRIVPLAVKLGFILALLLFLALALLQAYVSFGYRLPGTAPLQSTPQPTTPAQTKGDLWQALPPLPSPEADNTAVYVELHGRAYIYMSGGYRGPTASPRYDNSLYRYDIQAAHWEQVVVEKFPGMVNNAAVQDGQGHIFFTAGYSANDLNVPSLLYMYQLDDNTIRKIVPPKQIKLGFGSAMLADQKGHLYVSQGFMSTNNEHAQAGMGWYRYDIEQGQWHALAPLPDRLGYMLLTFDNDGGILLLGGAGDVQQQHQTDRIYRYDLAQNSWSQALFTLPRALSAAASCQLSNTQALIVGGYEASHNIPLGQAWLLNLRTLKHAPLTTFPAGSSVLGIAVCDGKGHAFLVRGASDLNHPTADFWQLNMRKA
ncbi:protein kinase domain-containing protein [Ktedonosporobacter rubrisoli]|nr:protein kinase [Ktedonosporobacter rubrisoli]